MSSHTNLHSAFHCFDMQMMLKKATALCGGERVYVFGERWGGQQSSCRVTATKIQPQAQTAISTPYLSIGYSHHLPYRFLLSSRNSAQKSHNQTPYGASVNSLTPPRTAHSTRSSSAYSQKGLPPHGRLTNPSPTPHQHVPDELTKAGRPWDHTRANALAHTKDRSKQTDITTCHFGRYGDADFSFSLFSFSLFFPALSPSLSLYSLIIRHLVTSRPW